MLKKQFNTFIGIAMSSVINIFMVSPAFAGTADVSNCDDAWPVWLESRQAAQIDPAGSAVRVHVPSDGYLLAESYSLEAGGEPQVVIDGVADIGADWLSGRLLPVKAGTYCIRVTSQSSRKPLGETRLAVAFAASAPSGLLKDGEEPPEEEDPPVSEEPPGEVLARTEALMAYSSLVPFDERFPSTKNGGEDPPEEEEPPVSEEPPGEVLVTIGGFDPMALLQKNGDGTDSDPEEEPPVSEESPGEVLVRGDVTAQVDPASLAQQLGLCAEIGSDWGSLACAKQMELGRWFEASEGALETFTFQDKEILAG